MLFKHLDERHEQGAVESVFVEIIRRNIGRSDDHNAAFKQSRKQPAENHGIGNVGDMKFVEAKQPSFLDELLGDQMDRIVVSVCAKFHLLTKAVDTLMHVKHEFVKMCATLAYDRTGLKKQVHKHRLAAPDVAVDVETLDILAIIFAAAEQPAERR